MILQTKALFCFYKWCNYYEKFIFFSNIALFIMNFIVEFTNQFFTFAKQRPKV